MRTLLAALTAVLALLIGGAAASYARPAPVPCTKAGGGHFTCQWYVAGDGIHGGAPVLSGAGARVGYLHQGSNWVVCQRAGRRQSSGRFYNHTWAWTEADDRSWGWVNAVWASGGDNNGRFGGVPACGTAHGNPPQGAAPNPAPAPAPAPKPSPRPRPRPGTVLPKPVNMGSYGTYTFRYQLWRDKKGKRQRWNFNDWTAAQMMRQLNSNFSHYFTFTGCGRHLHVGQRCSLDTTMAPDAPVKVVAIASNGFALRSMGGHPEGAGRTIRFEFQPYVNEAEVSSMSLLVRAWGPLSNSSLLGPLNSGTIASYSWDTFERNIRDRYPDVPPGGFSGPQVV